MRPISHVPVLPVGFVVLMGYGLVPTLQPQEATFSRVYAVYGVRAERPVALSS